MLLFFFYEELAVHLVVYLWFTVFHITVNWRFRELSLVLLL